MKVGDLIKFKAEVRGLESLIGIVVGWNGEAAVVHWNSDRGITDEHLIFIETLPEVIDHEMVELSMAMADL
jgi:hypothetical protein